MRVIYHTATSLDGYIADPAESLSWLFAQKHTEPDTPELRLDTLLERTRAILMGSSTYEWIHEQLTDVDRPHLIEDGAWPYKQPTWVMSHHQREPIDGAELFFASGDVRTVVDEISQRVQDPEGVLWLVGGGDLAGQLADAGLLDEVVVSYAPVTLGAGAPLLPRRVQLRLQASEVCGDFICARFLVEGTRNAADWKP